ncbi:MAG: hypothetical protein GX352_09620 [Clostridiales bacterium]|nr:hypothetical protein [Clostridiales bacterium]
MAVDGVVGPATRAALNAAVPGTEPETGGFKEFNPASGELKGKTVILDPGHGGRDSGAAWNGNLEKNFNLDMAKRLQRMLEKAGAKVLMTRTKDEYSYLYYRSSFVNKYIVDLELEDQKDQKTAAESVKADKGKELTKKKDAHILAQNLLDQYDLELSAKKAEALELSTNNNISDLRNELTKQETYRDVAKSNVEWLEARIEEINGLRDKISHLETKINGFDEEIKELEAELDKEKQEEEPDETNIGELENRIERLKSDKEYSKEKLDGKEGELDGLLAEIAGKFDEREPKAILDGLWEEIDGFEQRISVIKPIVKEYDALMDEARVLEEETVPKTKDDIAKLNGEISSLDKAISSLTTQIAAISAEITDLSSKSKALLNIINNPSLGSRTGIYKLDGKDKNGKNQINTQLKEVLDLTREKYDKNMIFVAVHCNAMGGGGTTTASGVQVYYRDSSADNGYAVNQYYYQNYNDKLRLKLAKAMLKNTRENTNFKGQWTTPFRKDFHVLREQNLPSVLMEIGFVNNPADVTLLNQEQTRENAAKGMYLGIAEYFKN